MITWSKLYRMDERIKLVSKTFSLNFVKLPCMQKFNINNYHPHNVPMTALTFSTITVKLTRKLLQTSRASWTAGRGNVRMKRQHLLSDCWLVKQRDVWLLLCRSFEKLTLTVIVPHPLQLGLSLFLCLWRFWLSLAWLLCAGQSPKRASAADSLPRDLLLWAAPLALSLGRTLSSAMSFLSFSAFVALGNDRRV